MTDDSAAISPEEAERHLAEAELFRAQADKARAETRTALASAEIRELEAEAKRRSERAELAADRHHHFYAFSEPVGGPSVQKCIDQLTLWLRTADGPLTVEIMFNSPGGSVIHGMALWDYIQSVKDQGHHVVTSAVGYAASMAGILLQAGHERVIGREAYILIHEVSFGAGGKIGEVEDEVAFIKKIQDRVLDIFASRSTLTKRQLANRWRRKDWWLDSDEALRLGFVDRVR